MVPQMLACSGNCRYNNAMAYREKTEAPKISWREKDGKRTVSAKEY